MKKLDELTLTEFVNVKEPPVDVRLTGTLVMSLIRQHLLKTGEIHRIAADKARAWIDANFRTMTLQEALDLHECESLEELQEKVTAWQYDCCHVLIRQPANIKIERDFKVGLKFLGNGRWKARSLDHTTLECEGGSAGAAVMDLRKYLNAAIDTGMEDN